MALQRRLKGVVPHRRVALARNRGVRHEIGPLQPPIPRQPTEGPPPADDPASGFPPYLDRANGDVRGQECL